MKFVLRSEWGARRAKNITRLSSASGVTYHWGGVAVGIRSHADCGRKVKQWQDFHMDSRGWADIAYNLIVCPHGTVFEGRGIHRRSAANGTNTGNASHYAICYLGGKGEPLSEDAKRGLSDARAYLRDKGDAGAEVKTHDRWKATDCPGDAIRAWVAAGLPVQATFSPTSTAPQEQPVWIVKDPSSNEQYKTNGFQKQYLGWAAYQAWIKAGVPQITLPQEEFDRMTTLPRI